MEAQKEKQEIIPKRICLEEAIRTVAIRLAMNPHGKPIKTTTLPILVGKCGCGAEIEIELKREQRSVWMQGVRIGLECSRCRSRYWAQRQVVKLATQSEIRCLG